VIYWYLAYYNIAKKVCCENYLEIHKKILILDQRLATWYIFAEGMKNK
jgi:hypothetical protein